MDTIYAVSSGQPPAAIAVLRVSGSRAFAAAAALAGSLPPLRRAGVRALRSGDGALLDRALVLCFQAPATATGEDLVELHCHGGRAVVAAVEAALADHPGLRRAEPGEFTRRALMNGRIDLASAEGLGDLLSAQTERQRIAALSAAEGHVSRAVQGWMSAVAALSARTEALLDFADEDDVDVGDEAISALIADVRRLGADISAVADAPPVDRLRDGVRVVIAGPPNTGKSTLLNLLGERDAAIVSPIAGTTRDRIEISVVRDGIAYILTDTAGLVDKTEDMIEAIGVARAYAAMQEADIIVWTDDTPPGQDGAVWIQSRADLSDGQSDPRRLPVSRTRPDSLQALWSRISVKAEAVLPRAEMLPLKREQQVVAREAASALSDVHPSDLLLVAEHLRYARTCLSRLLGIDATEAMLDALFGAFCIGK